MIYRTPDYKPEQVERRELDKALCDLLESVRFGTTREVLADQMERVANAMEALGMAIVTADAAKAREGQT